MVTSVNRWLGEQLLMLATWGVVVSSSSRGVNDHYPVINHPLHVSTTEINHNATDKSLEISCRLFVDDFEACLSKQYHTKVDLSAANVKTAMDSLVKKYLVA